MTQSVPGIRRDLTEAPKRLAEASPTAPAFANHARAVQGNTWIARTMSRTASVSWRSWGDLYTLFELQIAYLAIEYGIDVEDDLASIVPLELRADVDESRE